jgi:hypothetical protein
LPDKIQVLRVELPAGIHKVDLQPLASATVVGRSTAEKVEIANGRNTYMLAVVPDTKVVGSVLVSQP